MPIPGLNDVFEKVVRTENHGLDDVKESENGIRRVVFLQESKLLIAYRLRENKETICVWQGAESDVKIPLSGYWIIEVERTINGGKKDHVYLKFETNSYASGIGQVFDLINHALRPPLR
jgi:hypothetical protein